MGSNQFRVLRNGEVLRRSMTKKNTEVKISMVKS